MNIPVEVRYYPFQRIIRYLETGNIDAVLTFHYSEDRAKFIEYTIAYDDIRTLVFVKKGRSFPFEKWEDLIGLKGLMIRGRSEGEQWDNFRNANHLSMDQGNDLTRIIKFLDADRGDYGIGKEYYIQREARRIGYQDKIEILPHPLISNPVHIGFSKKSPFVRYIQNINEKILRMKTDGTFNLWMNEAVKLFKEN